MTDENVPVILYPPVPPVPIQGGSASTVVAGLPYFEWTGGDAKGSSNTPLKGGNARGEA